MFFDEAKIYVKSGDGGNGIVAFRREKYVPRGGPAGGDGGKGGDVILTVDPRLSTLVQFQRKVHFIADSGINGGSSNKTGAQGEDLIVTVPPGTIVREAESGNMIADLTHAGQRVVVARGGRGGKGNTRFKTSTNQAPRMAEKGEPGQERWLELELKVLADVGIVGVPNAGKSTLLSVISNARPKIAPYPFTTIKPNLGVTLIDDEEVVFADIPGLIEGAHEGIGLGHSFLRHIQRTKLLIHMLDGASPDPLADFNQINIELVLFDPNLGERTQIVVMNKTDLPGTEEKWAMIREEIAGFGYPVAAISAVTRGGVNDLLWQVKSLLAELPEPELEEEMPIYALDEDEDFFEIVRVDDAYRIIGPRIERAAAMTYWEYQEAIIRFQKILEALGIAKALIEAGIEPGDSVLIGDHELEWAD